jgi:serine protease Do
MRTAGLVILLFTATAFAQRPNVKAAGWLTDYAAAKAEAKRTGKPLFVVFRCEPCTDFAKFDARVTRLEKPLDEIADQFVRVRLARITGVDLSLFEFDCDLSWAGFFMNADEVVYGRYGGRDATSDDGRLSIVGLRYAMQKALDRHKATVEKPDERGKPILAENLKWPKARRGNDCIHCHQINEARRAEAKAAGTWTREDLWGYPLPENIGLTMYVDRGNLVRSVAADSAAAKIGFKADDVVSKLNGYPVASIADIQYSLHKSPQSGSIPIEWQRDGKSMSGKLEVALGWRKTDAAWRTSMFDLMPTLPVGGSDLSAEAKKALGLSETQAAFQQDKFVHSTLKAVGLKSGDVVVGMDGKKANGTMDDFLAFVRREYLVGDTVTLNVLRDGKPVEVKVTLK